MIEEAAEIEARRAAFRASRIAEVGVYVAADGVTHTNTIEGFFGHFKTDVRGTHHAVSRRWLQSYVNEWVWKWNHREDDHAMFWQLLGNAATPV